MPLKSPEFSTAGEGSFGDATAAFAGCGVEDVLGFPKVNRTLCVCGVPFPAGACDPFKKSSGIGVG